MSFQEYGGLSHPVPYVLNFETEKGALLYFGARHTHDPNDAQVGEIEELWESFCSTIAFIEGTETGTVSEELLLWQSQSREEVLSGGEPSWTRYLAAQDGVPARSLEPPRADEAAFLLEEFPAEQIRLFYILRDVPQRRGRMPEQQLDDYVKRAVQSYCHGWIPSLKGPPCSLAELAEMTPRSFPELADWRDIPQERFDPVVQEPRGFTNALAARSSQFRDQHMVALLATEVKKGQRAFAVVGASHVVMQERALKCALP